MAWDSVRLSGDIPSSVQASFLNKAKNSGQVTKGGQANLTITGLPASTIHSITLYMHSNTSAGSAMVMLSLGNSTWLAASGAFNQWPGVQGYSATDQPVSCLKQAQTITKGTDLKIQIRGQVNSVYVSKMVINYTLTPPTTHTLTLQWMTATGFQTQQLTEDSIGQGFLLPSVPKEDSVLTQKGESWYWLGWTETPCLSQTTSPLCWQTNDWYGPDEDLTLYALYSTSPERSLCQDSTMTSGEYALLYVTDITSLALAGKWKSGRLPLQTVDLLPDAEKNWVWKLNQLDDQFRYQLTFEDDSVLIYHPQTKTWMGYHTTMGGDNCVKWAWKKAPEGSLFLYGAQTSSPPRYSNLVIDYDLNEEYFYAAYKTTEYFSDNSYWRLFPTDQVPSPGTALYTTFDGKTIVTDLPSHPSPLTPHLSPVTKYMDPQGRMIIHYNHTNYNLLGQPL